MRRAVVQGLIPSECRRGDPTDAANHAPSVMPCTATCSHGGAIHLVPLRSRSSKPKFLEIQPSLVAHSQPNVACRRRQSSPIAGGAAKQGLLTLYGESPPTVIGRACKCSVQFHVPFCAHTRPQSTVRPGGSLQIPRITPDRIANHHHLLRRPRADSGYHPDLSGLPLSVIARHRRPSGRLAADSANYHRRRRQLIAHAVIRPGPAVPSFGRRCTGHRQIFREAMKAEPRIPPSESANHHPLPIVVCRFPNRRNRMSTDPSLGAAHSQSGSQARRPAWRFWCSAHHATRRLTVVHCFPALVGSSDGDVDHHALRGHQSRR